MNIAYAAINGRSTTEAAISSWQLAVSQKKHSAFSRQQSEKGKTLPLIKSSNWQLAIGSWPEKAKTLPLIARMALIFTDKHPRSSAFICGEVFQALRVTLFVVDKGE